ncbi:MAG TPA: RHS repeat-associated core domain-containing protein [Oculatellaceae cyanobacterium]
MKKPARAAKAVARNQALAKGNPGQSKSRSFPFTAIGWAVLGITSVTIAATATDLLQGNVRVEQSQRAVGQPAASSRSPQLPVKSAKMVLDKTDTLVDKYGAVANSSTVAAAIKKAEATGGQNADRALGAKLAADRDEALAHGYMLPGTNPTTALMYGFVPPGMSPEQAAILSKGLPKLPRAARTGPLTPDMLDRLAGLPPDPTNVLPQGPGRHEADTANQKILEDYTRERFGPVYVPSLHRDHNRVLQPTPQIADGTARHMDNQVSLISAQYNYDGGTGPASIREMTDASGNTVAQCGYDPYGRQTRIGGTGPDADFGYAGYYVHQRSGLNLTVHRAYSPSMGRWLNRDPIQDPTFGLVPESPEPQTPSYRQHSASQNGIAALLPFKNDPVVFSQVLKHINLPRREWHPGLNPYVYVANNPVNLTDPSGLSPFPGQPCPSPAWPQPWFDCAAKCAAQCSTDPDHAGCFLRCYTLCVWE